MRKSLGTIVFTFLLGMVLGAILSNVIALFLDPDSIPYQLFVKSVGFGPEVNHWDLVVLDITFGFKVHFNLMSVVGLFVAAQILRWYR